MVTAERVVSPDELRAIGPRKGIPAISSTTSLPRRSVHTHRGNSSGRRRKASGSYAEDYAFGQMLRGLVRDPKALRAWVERLGVLEPITRHMSDGSALSGSMICGREPCRRRRPKPKGGTGLLRRRSAPLSWPCAVRRTRRPPVVPKLSSQVSGSPILPLGRRSGGAISGGMPVALIAETGMVGFRPIVGDPYLFNRPNAASSLFHARFVQTLGVLAGANARNCLALLAAAQIDKRGNVNSSRSSEDA